ncbi:hypothetical protein [Frankia sp. CiP3]|uniref:hypothetical protein n=1 Tax=Frankia sp. CiP3 TaxID=2880971 RepID=UPI001EF69716|nr:hypothetical protein [Frankia sp. CiP3]
MRVSLDPRIGQCREPAPVTANLTGDGWLGTAVDVGGRGCAGNLSLRTATDAGGRLEANYGLHVHLP